MGWYIEANAVREVGDGRGADAVGVDQFFDQQRVQAFMLHVSAEIADDQARLETVILEALGKIVISGDDVDGGFVTILFAGNAGGLVIANQNEDGVFVGGRAKDEVAEGFPLIAYGLSFMGYIITM